MKKYQMIRILKAYWFIRYNNELKYITNDLSPVARLTENASIRVKHGLEEQLHAEKRDLQGLRTIFQLYCPAKLASLERFIEKKRSF